MPQDHKKQHFVAQFYLNRFGVKGGKIFVYDKAKDRVFPAGPLDIGHENHFLSIADLDQGAGAGSFFKHLFAGVEAAASVAIADVLDRLSHGMNKLVTQETREAAALFLALQHLRTREARDRISQSTDAMGRALRDVREEGTEEFKEWVDDALRRPHDPKHEHAWHLLNPRLVVELRTALYSHIWLIYAAPETLPLYTSDHPLALHSHTPNPLRGFGPRSFGTELQFALSPRYLLCLVERRCLETAASPLVELDGMLAGSLAPEHVAFQRSLQVRDSRRFVFCSEDEFNLAREMCESYPELRDPNRPRVTVVSGGRPL
jgi:hypothetical protein